MIEQKYIDRFGGKVDKSGDCWEWIDYKHLGGYGKFWFREKHWPAHRFSWLLHNGIIPEGMLICHHCDNKACVNPAHLFLGTSKDNAQDAIGKGRWSDQTGEANGGSKLTDKKVLSIRASKMTQRELGRKYNVDQTTIHAVVTRKTWTHI